MLLDMMALMKWRCCMKSLSSNKMLVPAFVSLMVYITAAFPASARAEAPKDVAHRLGRDLAIVAVSPIAGAALAGAAELEENNMPNWERPVACTTGALIGVVAGPVMAIGYTGYDMLHGLRNEEHCQTLPPATSIVPRIIPSGFPNSRSRDAGVVRVSIDEAKSDNPPQLIWQSAETLLPR